MLPDFDKPFRIETDASGYGVGGVISQFIDKYWRPVAFFSRHLSRRERNYSALERELLAAVSKAEHFKRYIYGKRAILKTDHEPLKYLVHAEDLSGKIARWVDRLMNFDIVVEYRKGKLNGNADALSRVVDHCPSLKTKISI